MRSTAVDWRLIETARSLQEGLRRWRPCRSESRRGVHAADALRNLLHVPVQEEHHMVARTLAGIGLVAGLALGAACGPAPMDSQPAGHEAAAAETPSSTSHSISDAR